MAEIKNLVKVKVKGLNHRGTETQRMSQSYGLVFSVPLCLCGKGF